MKRLTPHELHEKVDHLYDDKLVLCNIDYVYARDALQIQCKLCSRNFTRKRKGLLAGKVACPDCAKEDRRISAQAKFIEDSRRKHGDRYNYSKVFYRSSKEQVTIIFNVSGHGEFLQLPEHHRRGRGCPKCASHTPTSLDSFIARAQETHGDKFDYSLVRIENMRDQVTIVCPKGHRFEQAPYSHLAGNGCPTCAGVVKTTEDIILEAIRVHGDRYDYANTHYVSAKDQLEITCQKHGAFTQVASNHLQGNGCPKCGGTQKMTDAEFLARAREKHNNQYDYSQFVFGGYTVLSTIVCDKHGPFLQSPKVHLRHGCPKCGRELQAGQQGIDAATFIQKAQSVHGHRYTYAEVVYKTSRHKVTIECPTHGPFLQAPGNHLSGHGCPKCARGQFMTNESFLERAQQTHSMRYQYTEVEFRTCSQHVVITCPYHGDFRQRPSDHLRGRGCPRCRMSRGESMIQRVLTEIGVLFQWQWQCPDGSPGLRRLRWDFCIFADQSKTIPVGLIEFQGEQHHRPVNFGASGGNDMTKSFADVQRRDNEKREHAKKMGIPLLELSREDLPLLRNQVREFLEQAGALSPGTERPTNR